MASAKLPLVSCAFDGGNIVQKGVLPLDGGAVQLRLAIKPDVYTNGTDKTAHAQWFYFKVRWFRARNATYVTGEAHAAAPHLTRHDSFTEVDDDAATVAGDASFLPLARYNSDARTFAKPPLPPWSLTPEYDTVYFAYWTPYSLERHADVVAELATSPLCEAWSLGQSLDGRDLDVLTFGTGRLQLWVAARQHPGETMAEWAAEGCARKLADADDPKARASVLRPERFLRAFDLENDEQSSPSCLVYHMLKHLDARGCDGYVDIHGDEEIEANFTAGAEGCPCYDAAMAAHYEGFCHHFCKATPDFQHAPGVEGRGYEPTPPGEANLSVCTNAIATRYGCLAVTLEQPFKDSTFHTPEPVCGWSGPRALKLGAALVDALLDTVWDGDGGVEVTLEALLAKLEAENPSPSPRARPGRSSGAARGSARARGPPLPCGWRPPADEAFFEETKAEAPRRAAPAAAPPVAPARRPVSQRSSRESRSRRRSKASRAAAQGRRDDAALAEALSDRARSSGRTRSGLARGAAAVAVVGCALAAGLRRAGLAPAPPLRPRTSLACRTTFETSGSAFASTFEGHADAESAVADLAAKCGVTSRRGLRTHWWRMLCGGLARFETADAYDAAAVACGRAVDDTRLPDRVDGPAPGDLKREAAAAIHALGAIRQTRGDLDGALAAYADAHDMAPLALRVGLRGRSRATRRRR
ncbi:hypothetical protein JL722_6365 [Aureococcus anophagefferens]|nr:hypothetical protein JL722_6365 [Aureococcus anophagefferens]